MAWKACTKQTRYTENILRSCGFRRSFLVFPLFEDVPKLKLEQLLQSALIAGRPDQSEIGLAGKE